VGCSDFQPATVRLAEVMQPWFLLASREGVHAAKGCMHSAEEADVNVDTHM
jgi:hypothetical protein